MNAFHSAITAALGQIRTAVGVPVVYRRGAYEVPLTATPGSSEYEVDSGHAVMKAHSRDYLIAATDLVLNDEQTLPKRGDQIVETDAAGELITHEVMGPTRGAEWDWSDPARTQLRIRTKQVATGEGA